MDNCPRCGFKYDPDSGLSLAEQQVKVCAYCAENQKRILTHRQTLAIPTAEFPTWPNAGGDE